MIYDRKNKTYQEESTSASLLFFYENIIGRLLLKIATMRFVSNIVGIYMNSRLSKRKIKKFINKNNIDMSEYEEVKYKSFNEFFSRKIKPNKRHLPKDKNMLCAPADSKLTVYKIDENCSFKIKNSIYTVDELLQDKRLSKRYKDGYILVFRLCVDDYHRYSYIDDGKILSIRKIKGVFHTVQPIAFKKYKVFHENQREYCIIKTKHFGDVIQMEVGALCVGKIVNHEKEEVLRGEEKGYFKFGGSTIILMLEKDKVIIDEDILEENSKGIEVRVHLFEEVGRLNK